MFASQSQAKRFFANKIIAQAALENINLSEAEGKMLLFSESDPEFILDPAIVARFDTEISEQDYEIKVTDLLQRAYKHDIESDCNAQDIYRKAYEVLRQGDHYLQVMIDQAIGRKVRFGFISDLRLELLLKIGRFALLFMFGIISIILALGIVFAYFMDQSRSSFDMTLLEVEAPLLGGLGIFLIYSWLRKR